MQTDKLFFWFADRSGQDSSRRANFQSRSLERSSSGSTCIKHHKALQMLMSPLMIGAEHGSTECRVDSDI